MEEPVWIEFELGTSYPYSVYMGGEFINSYETYREALEKFLSLTGKHSVVLISGESA